MASVLQAFVAGVEDAVMREADYNKASEKDGVCGKGNAVNGDGGSVNQVAMRDTLVGKRMLKENGGRDKLVKASNQKTMADGKQDAKKKEDSMTRWFYIHQNIRVIKKKQTGTNMDVIGA
ncbi:uncharacterized protein [Musca autumnalis]|uniref:uncharacterized protein n=1 Tax=Musca autumnalis TaxID=221902 RepID=UPI003CE7A2B7